MAAVLRAAGLEVSTGTVNEVELALRVIELAAPDTLCTDRPIELRSELEAAGVYVAPAPTVAMALATQD